MSSTLWKAVLPYPPTLGQQYTQRKGTTKGGKTFFGKMLSPEAKAFRERVAIEVRRGHRTPPRLSGRLSITVLALPPDRRADGRLNRVRKDTDNLWKALLDALTKTGVILDDCLFDDSRIIRGNPIAGGRVIVAISPFDPEASSAVYSALFEDELRSLPSPENRSLWD